MSGKLFISVDRDGWSSGIQVSINDDAGGCRIAGPKYNGSSANIKTVVIDRRVADDIRHYLDKHFPHIETIACKPQEVML